MNGAQYRSIKNSLVSVIACEYRYHLWFPLVEALGTERTIALLNEAEAVAKTNVKSVSFNSLIEP